MPTYILQKVFFQTSRFYIEKNRRISDQMPALAAGFKCPMCNHFYEEVERKELPKNLLLTNLLQTLNIRSCSSNEDPTTI